MVILYFYRDNFDQNHLISVHPEGLNQTKVQSSNVEVALIEIYGIVHTLQVSFLPKINFDQWKLMVDVVYL